MAMGGAGLVDQAVLVTGANRGLGRGVAEQLRDGGARVIATARTRAALDELAQAGFDARPLDVADPISRAGLVAGLPPLDGLVNNAGVALSGFDLEVARTTLAVNLRAPVALAQTAPLAAGARVVMVSSGMGELAGFGAEARPRIHAAGTVDAVLALADAWLLAVERGTDGALGWPRSAYRVSKALLNAATKALARDLGAAARVNAVCPGWVRTDMGGAGAPRGVPEGAASILWALGVPPDGPTGGFFRDGRAIPF